VAAPLAAQWGELAPPPSAMLEAARRAARACGCEALRLGGRASSGGGARAQTEEGLRQIQALASWWAERRARQLQQQGREPGGDRGAGPAAAPAAPGRPAPAGAAEAPVAAPRAEASAADAAAVELGLRQLQELGVDAAVASALAERARERRAVVQLPQAVRQGGPGGRGRGVGCAAHAGAAW
jgi:hypothetical protein